MPSFWMRRGAVVGLLATAVLQTDFASARGVTPYLPLNMDPLIERQIERVLILSGKSVIRRPIPAALVLEALPRACSVDTALCDSVRSYLTLYMKRAGITRLQAELTETSGDSVRSLANARGRTVDSHWNANASGYYQPYDHLLLSAGGVAYEGRVMPTGSVLSAGFDFAQLDIGYRDHWFSPMSDSSMLLGTQAPTFRSITLSNYRPLTRLGIQYEVFIADISKQEGIAFKDSTTDGRPQLAGLQLGIEPAEGFAFAVNRLMQYGGGARGEGGLSGFKDALFRNNQVSNNDTQNGAEEFGNQEAALTASAVFGGTVPFALRIEYAGEDNSFQGSYRLGNTAITLGIDFPILWKDYDLSYEITEFQNIWYVHHLYPDGLTNEGHVIGNWFGDQRVFGDAVGGRSQVLKAGWQWRSDRYMQLTYRTLANQPTSNIEYLHLHELGLRYSAPWHGYDFATELQFGRDVFGEKYSRLSATVNLVPWRKLGDRTIDATNNDSEREIFFDLGSSRSQVNRIRADFTDNVLTEPEFNYHVGVGVRREVSRHSDLGLRVEFDRADGNDLISFRALDYRYRFNKTIAAGAFFGAARYDVGLPAYGYYGGVGIQYLNLLPNFDLGLDIHLHEKLSRNKLLSSDPPAGSAPAIYFDVKGVSLYLSRKF